LTLAAIYDGATRSEAAKIGGVGLQIIRDWVLRFNARALRACWIESRQANPPSSMMASAR
jgi:transposase